jgi:glycine oxidase
MSPDVIVIGGGVIGLAIARSLVDLGSVLVIERNVPGREASWAAAGMLSPLSEAREDDAFFRFCLDGLGRYPNFVDELQAETGIDLEYRADGVLVLAAGADELNQLSGKAAWLERSGLEARLLSPDQVGAMEPALTMDLAGGLFCPGDHQVRPRQLMTALERSCAVRGVEFLKNSVVHEVLVRRGHVAGVRAGTAEIRAGAVIVAAGAWAGRIGGLAPPLDARPRKGQILALKMPGPVFRRVIRWGSLYLVPRNDHEVVVGATDEDCGFDRGVTASGLCGLLRGACEMASTVGSFPLVETWTGFRPALPDDVPAIGPGGIEGLYYAVGHYRNGILLAPGTADLIAGLVSGGNLPSYAGAFAPGRFSSAAR